MDPIATLRDMLDAIEARDWETAYNCSVDLDNWFEAGGFAPGLDVERLIRVLSPMLGRLFDEQEDDGEDKEPEGYEDWEDYARRNP